MPTTANSPHAGSATRRRLLAAAPLEERQEVYGGISTAVLEGGAGPPLLLLHGQGEFWGVWMRVLDDLVRTHRVVAVDLPGHGGSEVIDARLDVDGLRRWLDELIDATCSEPPVLVGHLLGGAIAARYAARDSARIAGLVLVDTLGLTWFRPAPRFAAPMALFMARPTQRSRDRLFRQCFVDFDTVGRDFGESWEDLLGYALDRAQTAQNKAALRAVMPRVGVPPIPRDDLDRIEVPTTLIHGRHGLQVPLRAAERTAQRQGWPLHVIEGARDDPAAEQPAAFLAALRTALRGETARDDEEES